MPVWIPVTVSAALFQCWRTAMQQKLRHLLSVNGAGFVRYLYGAPTALVLLVGALIATGLPLPAPNVIFVIHCAVGGLMQILATNLLIMAFGYRNFAVGTAYSKTETAQSAIIALIVLHEVLRPASWVGICIGLAGVMTLSLAGRGMRPSELARATVQPAALAGLGAGFLFALTTVFIKLANQALTGPSLSRACAVRAGRYEHAADRNAGRLPGAGANRRSCARHSPRGAVQPGSARCPRSARPAGLPHSRLPRSGWCARSGRSRSCSP